MVRGHRGCHSCRPHWAVPGSAEAIAATEQVESLREEYRASQAASKQREAEYTASLPGFVAHPSGQLSVADMDHGARGDEAREVGSGVMRCPGRADRRQ